MYNKNLAGVLALLFGVFGAHYFYLGQRTKGILMGGSLFLLIFLVNLTNLDVFGMGIGALAIASFLTAILWWAMPYERWAAKYDPEGLAERQRNGGASYLHASGRPDHHPHPYAAPNDRLGSSGRTTIELRREGVRYFKTHDYDLAAEAFAEALDADPTDAGAHFNLAATFARLGRHPEALQHLELAATYRLDDLAKRIETHPALAELRTTAAYRSFARQNFRNLAFGTESAPPPAPSAATEPSTPATAPPEEVLEDFSTPPAPPPAAPTDDLLDQLTRLQELRDAGILTPTEFEQQKERILA